MARSARPQDGSARGELLRLLCSADRTTSELARELGMSSNGVRNHLMRLEKEGLVEHRVVRRGVGKPAHEYHLTDEGALRISRAYLQLLTGILNVIEQGVGTEATEALLRGTGRTLAHQYPRPDGPLRVRAEAGIGLLGALGGIGTLDEAEGELWIRGSCCPLRALVPDHPLTCRAIEAMLTEFIGAPVREQCDKQDPPRCQLVIAAAAER